MKEPKIDFKKIVFDHFPHWIKKPDWYYEDYESCMKQACIEVIRLAAPLFAERAKVRVTYQGSGMNIVVDKVVVDKQSITDSVEQVTKEVV